jgi:signal transduction histidine kinase
MKPPSKNNENTDFYSQLSNPDTGVWELIFDSIPDMVALIDLDNIVVRANAAMRKNINIGEKEINTGEKKLTGKLCYNLMHHQGCASTNCPHRSMILDRKPHTIEMFEPKLNLFLEISTIPLFDSDNNLLGSLHIARDITIQKESEEKLKKYNAELKELNHSKDKFFSIVAHDLRSPFQGMLGFTDLILDELDTLTKEEIKEYLQKVRDSSYSTFSLLENLLNWSRLQTGRMQYTPSDFSLSETVAGVFSLLDSNAQSKNIRLINNIKTDYPVFADRQMVHSILLNLATNAIKFTYPGGTVSFAAKIRQMCHGNEDKKSILNQRCLEISVSDTGTGMPAETIERIFKIDDQFSLAGTDNEQGAGLGLILVKEMVEKHGGSLNISSQEGKGSVFAFTIPLAEVLF